MFVADVLKPFYVLLQRAYLQNKCLRFLKYMMLRIMNNTYIESVITALMDSVFV